MSTKHTPGPWALETVQTACGICHKIGPFPWREGEANHACVYVDNGRWANADELLANARLIAAAPELLEALEGFMNEIGRGETLHIKIDAARAAIAKAKGE